jgi:SH3-like domain-containing protein
MNGLSSPRRHFPNPSTQMRMALAVLCAVIGAFLAVPAFAADTPSGLPLPRFVTTRSNPINVRVGPGTRYDVAWVYVKSGVPVEIIQEFDTWRKIRDKDGAEGWVHQNMLSGKRAGVVGDWAEGQLALRASANEDASVRAWIGAGYRVDIVECNGKWCEVGATDHPENGRTATYWGYLPQPALWGVYQDEVID